MFARVLACLIVVIAASSVLAESRDESLISKVPGGANTLLYYDVEGTYQSPLGRQEGWVNRFSETKAITLDSLPPKIKHLVIASRTNFARLEPMWKVGIAKMNSLVPLANVAEVEHGTIGQVAGQSTVLSPRNTYITSVGMNEIGSFHPADRQALSAWLKDIQAKKTAAPAYLLDAARSAADAQIVAAVHLADVVDPQVARHYLSHSPLVQQKKLDVDSLSKLFGGLKGFALSLRITDRLEGQLKIDFEGGVNAHRDDVQALIYEVMADGGVAFEELKSWQPVFTDTAVTLRGNLTQEAFHRLLCFFDMPAFYVREAQKNQGSTTGTLLPPTAPDTLRYFNSLSAIVNELRRTKMIDDNYSRYATWWDLYAKKIDQLPTAGVDQDVLAFGNQTADRMRAIAGSLRGVPIKIDQIGQTGYMVVGASRWGVTSMDTNVGQVREQQLKVIQGDKNARQETWKKIDDGMNAMKQMLFDRYKVPVG